MLSSRLPQVQVRRLSGPTKGLRRPRRRSAIALGAAVSCLLALSACGPSAPRDPVAPVLEDDGIYRVEVLMKDMTFDPETITVPDGAHLVLEVENVDGMPHDLVLEDGFTSDLLARGEKQTVDVGVVDGQMDGWCAVTGHREAGMVLTINV